jgi:endonuclease YncB( thermonuclease family)
VFAAALATSIASAANPWVFSGPVVCVSDGDTIIVLDRETAQHKIRLSGTDATGRSGRSGSMRGVERSLGQRERG